MEKTENVTDDEIIQLQNIKKAERSQCIQDKIKLQIEEITKTKNLIIKFQEILADQKNMLVKLKDELKTVLTDDEINKLNYVDHDGLEDGTEDSTMLDEIDMRIVLANTTRNENLKRKMPQEPVKVEIAEKSSRLVFEQPMCIYMEENFNDSNIIRFLSTRGLISVNTNCGSCGNEMTLIKSNKQKDGCKLFCYKCYKEQSIRKNTFFQNSKMTLKEIMKVMVLWVTRVPVRSVRAVIGSGSYQTFVDWYNYMREICGQKLDSLNLTLGGKDKTVQIDEPVLLRFKGQRCNQFKQQWIFGMFETDSKVGLIKMIDDPSTPTLVPIILNCVRPGTKIHSDSWASFDCLSAEGYIAEQRDYSSATVGDLKTESHTHHLESFWSRLERQFNIIYGNHGELKWSHIQEAQYRYWFDWRTDNSIANLEMFLQHVKEMYNK